MEQKRRDRDRREQEAVEKAARERRGKAVAKAEVALDEAKRTHDTRIEEIATARSALDRQSEAEEARWDQQRATLQAALNQARG